MKKIICVLFVIISATPSIFSQSAFVFTGGDVRGFEGGSVSYSFGQVSNNSFVSESISISEGVQQPYELHQSSFNDVIIIRPGIKVFPNPVSNILYITFDVEAFDMYPGAEYIIQGVRGRKLAQGSIQQQISPIRMRGLSIGVYFLQIYNNKKELIEVFKIMNY